MVYRGTASGRAPNRPFRFLVITIQCCSSRSLRVAVRRASLPMHHSSIPTQPNDEVLAARVHRDDFNWRDAAIHLVLASARTQQRLQLRCPAVPVPPVLHIHLCSSAHQVLESARHLQP